jgi:hypothetical protein
MPSGWYRANIDRWEKGFAALSKFRARKGHCLPSSRHVEGKFNLGVWVRTQRYYKDNLSVERKRRLNAIGFVWDWLDYRWEQGFTALLKFKRREGHCRVPIFHSEANYKLGWWVSTQRQRRKKKELSSERKARLNKIGFVWNESRGGRSHRAWRKRREEGMSAKEGHQKSPVA